MLRTEKIDVRLTPDEKAAVKATAESLGIDMATFCRMAALEKARKENA